MGHARVGVAAQLTAGYDLVVGDAFGYLVVPWHLATKEMADDIARVLRPDGVYAQNVIDYPPDRFVKAELATVAADFPQVALIAPADVLAGQVGSNFVIVASKSPLPIAELRARLGRADKPVTLLDGAAHAGAGQVLTDDYAPVDQLLAG